MNIIVCRLGCDEMGYSMLLFDNKIFIWLLSIFVKVEFYFFEKNYEN